MKISKGQVFMPSQQPTTERDAQTVENERDQQAEATDSREMPCPVCGAPMPDLKGGKASICPACGFKESCCY
jgi:membrane protease subunit (stomatin/prohibitin family)